MSQSLLLDTHIALWLETADARLRPGTRALIDTCWRAGGTIFLSAVSAWEIALFASLGRFTLDLPADLWVARFLERPGIESAPLTPFAAARSYQLQNLEHRDPGDLLLVATALELRCPLVTYDEAIIKFEKTGGRYYGFAVAS
jgi:PIN domain nuclease of toxin-antitoxin system